ncbi:MAG: phage portal protein [Anaerolineae bacterium]
MFNWLSTVFPRRRGLRPAPHVQAVALHNSYRWPNLAEAQAQSELYRQSPWVYIAVNRIAEAAALVPLRVRPRFAAPQPSLPMQNHIGMDAKNDVPTAENDAASTRNEVRHPLETLLDAPNPYLSQFELIEQTLGMLELTGDAYWFLSGDAAGVPTEIWPLRPDRVSIVPDAGAYIKGYVYEIDGQRIPLMPLEVVHFKRWHPANDYYGLSALEAARLAVSSDRAMAEWNKNTFGADNGVPAGVVSIKNTVNDADFERIKREWRQSYGGPQRTTAFLRGGDVEWKNIGLNHNELDFLRGRQAHRDEILNIFGIPVGLVSENATEANATVAERLFIERTLWPKLVRLAQKITQDLLPFWPGNYVAAFDDIRPTDTQARLDEIRTAYPVMSINEIRQRYYRLPATLWGQLPVGAQKNLNQTADNSANSTPTAADHTVSTDVHDGNSVIEPVSLAALLGEPAANKGLLVDTIEPVDADAIYKELQQWERYTLRRVGKTHSRPFEIHAVPAPIAFELSASLLAAHSEADVRAAFAEAYAALEDEPLNAA